MELDAYDKRIIDLLLSDSRRPIAAIARKIRLSKESVYYRVNRLVKTGYIENFFTLINASRIGFQYYRIYLKFRLWDEDMERKVVNFLRTQKSCTDLDILEGYYNLTFLTMHKDQHELGLFIDELSQNFGLDTVDKSLHLVTKLHVTISDSQGNTEDKIIVYDSPSIINHDDLDIKILNLLARDSRIQSVALSNKLHFNVQSIRYHLKKLEKSGIVVGYTASLGIERFGYFPIQVNFRLSSHKVIPKLLEILTQLKTLLWSLETIGKYDLSVKIIVEDMPQVLSHLEQLRKEIGNDLISYELSYVRKHYTINPSPFQAILT